MPDTPARPPADPDHTGRIPSGALASPGAPGAHRAPGDNRARLTHSGELAEAPWPGLHAAREHAPQARLPLHVLDQGRAVLAGSVARCHLTALAAWPQALAVTGQAVVLRLPADERTAFLALVNRQLQAAGLLPAWRDETYPLLALQEATMDRAAGAATGAGTASPPGPPLLLASLERAASRFWGTLTFGAHCNGYVTGPDGRPSHLWIARRARDKAVDPGRLDNLIGGGVPLGQTPAMTLVREGWEEAGLLPAQMAGIQPGRRFAVLRDVAEGLQREQVSVYDLALPAGLTPRNQDGEVDSFMLMPLDRALAHAAAGDMTVDASLATLDFALRHRLLGANLHQHLRALSEGLWCGPALLDR